MTAADAASTDGDLGAIGLDAGPDDGQAKVPPLIVRGPGGTVTLSPGQVYWIGRDPDADVAVDAPVVSWRHAQLLATAGQWLIQDAASTNGTFSSGLPVPFLPRVLGEAVQTYAPLVYASVMLLAGLIRHPLAGAIGVGCVCLILVGWVLRVRSDEGDWVHAARLQDSTLATLARELPVLPSRSAVVAVSFPGQTAPGVPVFEATWDLSGALQLTRRDETLKAFPVFDDDVLACGARALVASGPGSFGRNEIAYGRLYLVSPTRHRRVTGEESCRAALEAFPLGPREA